MIKFTNYTKTLIKINNYLKPIFINCLIVDYLILKTENNKHF